MWPRYGLSMTSGPYIAEAASLIGDPARANMLAALMDGGALTAGELAYCGRIAASTASEHLAKLTEGRLVTVVRSGRHRYYRLASPRVADALERLMALAVEGPPRHRPRSRCDEAMARARTCYDHLAGRLGVGIAESLANRKHIQLGDDVGLVTDEGVAFLGEIGVQLPAANRAGRAICRPCMDWSERRWHIGGALGVALGQRCFELGWTERQRGTRALTITPAGEEAVERLFGIRL